MSKLFKWFKFGKSKKNKIAIGIDFGTTMSRITYVQTNQTSLPADIPSVPSIVSAHRNPKISSKLIWNVGESALNHLNKSRIKLEIGVMKPIYKIPEQIPDDPLNEIRPEVLAGRIIFELKRIAEQFDPSVKDIKDVTITVPAEWSILHRNATIFAAKIAGFNNVNIIEEPVAAYLAIEQFKKDNIRKAKKILVFDCGGGTLDVTIIINEEGKLPFAAGRATDENVAGENIDDKLSKKLFSERGWEDLDEMIQQRDLSRQVKKLKEALNPKDIADPLLAEAKRNEKTYIGNIWNEQITLPLDLHNQVVQDIVEQGKIYLNEALSSCYINGERVEIGRNEIDRVILVGGSSYLRPLQKMVKEYFGKNIKDDEIILYRPEELVAIGAALWQSYIQNEEEKFQPTLSMKTYLRVQEWESGKKDLKHKDILLGNPGDILPIEIPKGIRGQINAPIIDIPKGIDRLEWKVYQNFLYSDKDGSMPVEWINFAGKISGLERIRLEYIIGRNGTIVKWKPSFILSQDKDITPEFKSYYDWAEEDPDEIARKYSVRY
jgi:molecular chaperone DnaK (HSP70)